MTLPLTVNFPGTQWEARPPEELGFAPDRLQAAERSIQERLAPDARCRVVVVRSGYLAAEWSWNLPPEERVSQASAAKSVFSTLLGVAIAEGKVPSADARVARYYPEMLDVPEGTAHKPNRSNKPEDAEITFRQLITNSSGYLKPGELPGKVYHYQTLGMNILMHALGKIYGVYETADPEGSVGPGELIRQKIRDPIGGTWTWCWNNFKDMPATARLGIFGYYTRLSMTCRDQARLGWLWRNEGRWGERQVVPAEYIRQATVTAPHIIKHCPQEDHRYGHGFWTNDQGLLWPSLPRDSFAAHGAGRQHIWVAPGLDLVVAQSPGFYKDQRENEDGVLRWVVDALE